MGFLYSISGKSFVLVGRDDRCDIVIYDQYVSRVHFRIRIFEDVNIADVKVESKNGIRIDKRIIKNGGSCRINTGSIIEFGSYRSMYLREYFYIGKLFEENISPALISGHMRKINFNELIRSSSPIKREFVPAIRKSYSIDLSPIEIEGPPQRKQPERASIALAAGPALTMAIPILLGCGRALSILTSVFAGFWAVSNVLSRRRKLKNEERRRRNSYLSYIEECEERIKSRLSDFVTSLEREYPSIDKYFSGGGNPFLMWNREINDSYYCIRIGSGSIDFPVEIITPKERFNQIDDSLKNMPAELKDKYRIIEKAIITIDLSTSGRIGINYTNILCLREFLANLLLQLLSNTQPGLYSVNCSLANGKIMVGMDFLNILSRLGTCEESQRQLLITDNVKDLTDNAFNEQMTIIYISEQYKKLPSYIDTVISISPGLSTLINLKEGGGKKLEFIADRTNLALADEYIRRLMKLSARFETRNEKVPDKVDFLDICPAESVESIIAQWRKSNICEEIAIPMGMGDMGRLISLDLHEKNHGPHGIIAGTTGAGKSELLVTMILSAALRFPPDKLGFFLIDYKGGGMANLFKGLPHLYGNISNLSKEESMRARASLRGENRRRQQIFNECKVNNISDYTRGYDEGRFIEPLPHILIIIDEFAELKKEQPDFIQELISVAAIGRSLGVHLILATQKPAGVIDDKIRSNSKFRIALRVADKSDSNDILKNPDASFIRNVGRAYLQVGNEEVYELFQCAYACGQRSKRSSVKIVTYDEDFNELTGEVVVSNLEKEEEEGESTLNYLLRNIIMAEAKVKSNKPKSLWLPPLPSKLYVEDISEKEYPLLGLMDSPNTQSYIPMKPEMGNLEHTCIIGPPLSGRSSFLRTYLSILLKHSAFKRLYIIDFGGGILRDFELSNRCGGYISTEEGKRIPMLLNYLREELVRYRKESSAISQMGNAFDNSSPAAGAEVNIILAVDNYSEAFKECSEEASAIIGDILKYGKGLGIIMVCTALGSSTAELPPRVLEKIEKIYILGRMENYLAAALLKSQVRQIPGITDVCGRGLVEYAGNIYEFQTAQYKEKDAITHVIEEENDRITNKILSYPYIPAQPGLEDFLKRTSRELSKERILKSGLLPVAYEEKSGKLYMLPIGRISLVLITGRIGSGRRNFLSVIKNTSAWFGVKEISINSITVFEQYLKQSDQINNPTIFTIDNLDKLLGEHALSCDKSFKNQFASYFDNRIASNPNIVIVAIASDRLKTNVNDIEIYDHLVGKPYGIRFGGGLDEERILDFSYIPYSLQNKKREAGEATVVKYQNGLYCGNIIVPLSVEREEVEMNWYS